MGGFFGVASKEDCVFDLFFGTDYHSHLGTRRAGMAVYSEEHGFEKAIHKIDNAPFRTKFDKEANTMKGNFGIGCISDYEAQPILVRSHHGTFAITTVGKINNAQEIIDTILQGRTHFFEMSNGEINATELVAAIIDQKDNFIDGIRYAQEIIPRSQTMRSPARYLNKVLREDMDNYRIYIFRKAKPAAEPKEELLEAEYHVMDEPVQQTMPEPEPPKVELIPETIVKRQDMRKEFAKFVDDEYLEKTLTSGQRGAYHEIYRHLAARCVPSPSSLRNGLKDEMRVHYLACMNEVIEKYGSLTPLMEAMAHELDFDVFWAKAAKDPNVNNPMGLFYHIIEERALNPIGTIMNDQAQRQKVAAKEKGEKDKWHNESWMDAFEEDIPDDSEE